MMVQYDMWLFINDVWLRMMTVIQGSDLCMIFQKDLAKNGTDGTK